MKHLATIVGAVIWLLSSTPAQAQEKFQYKPLQVQAVVSGDFEVDWSLKLVAQTTYFTVPDSNLHMGFSYFGVRGQLHKRLWIAVKFGVAHNWEGSWPLIASVWMGVDIYKKYLTFFAMADMYSKVQKKDYEDFPPMKELRDFYGYYSVDSQFLKWMSAGFHVEHVNTDVTFGAHVMFNYKALSFGLEHHVGVQEAVKGHSLRLIMKVHFSGS